MAEITERVKLYTMFLLSVPNKGLCFDVEVETYQRHEKQEGYSTYPCPFVHRGTGSSTPGALPSSNAKRIKKCETILPERSIATTERVWVMLEGHER